MGHTSRSSHIPPPPTLPEDFRHRVVVKFREDVQLAYEDDAHEQLLQRGILPWGELTETFGPITLDRVFFSLSALELSSLEREARGRNPSLPSEGFFRYFEVHCPPEKNAEALAARLESYPVVKQAYVATPPASPPAVTPGDDPLYATQHYLDPAPVGVSAAAAWAVAGGNGAGVDFVDIEDGWNLIHQDLPKPSIPLLSGVNYSRKGHGTSVLGIICAVDNRIGCIGLAPAASVSVASRWHKRGRPGYNSHNTEDALTTVTSRSSKGSIVLLEAQTASSLPMEVEDAIFFAIAVMTSRDVTLIECAGNGGHDLDDYPDSYGRHILFPGGGDFRDSGAIMVAGSKSGLTAIDPTAVPARSRSDLSNYGSRLDCYAWGHHVVTTGDGYDGTSAVDYMTLPIAFGGTSAAGAIVAGVSICVQGIARQQPGGYLSARALRGLLTDPLLGTASNSAADRIGQMPDLQRIAIRVTNGVPVIY